MLLISLNVFGSNICDLSTERFFSYVYPDILFSEIDLFSFCHLSCTHDAKITLIGCRDSARSGSGPGSAVKGSIGAEEDTQERGADQVGLSHECHHEFKGGFGRSAVAGNVTQESAEVHHIHDMLGLEEYPCYDLYCRRSSSCFRIGR